MTKEKWKTQILNNNYINIKIELINENYGGIIVITIEQINPKRSEVKCLINTARARAHTHIYLGIAQKFYPFSDQSNLVSPLGFRRTNSDSIPYTSPLFNQS